MLVSQPLMRLASQSPNPGSQIGVHTAATQLVDPPGFVHIMPQPLQFDASVAVLVSHKSAGLLLQSRVPFGQPVHTRPTLQYWTAAVHAAITQAPQRAFVFSGASQPFAAFMSQLPKPAVQLATVHAPAAHPAAPFAGIAHAFPHIPQ